jgi:hypothetical protein
LNGHCRLPIAPSFLGRRGPKIETKRGQTWPSTAKQCRFFNTSHHAMLVLLNHHHPKPTGVKRPGRPANTRNIWGRRGDGGVVRTTPANRANMPGRSVHPEASGWVRGWCTILPLHKSICEGAGGGMQRVKRVFFFFSDVCDVWYATRLMCFCCYVWDTLSDFVL